MKLFVEGNLRIVENSQFIDKKTNEKVPYFTNYIQDEDGELQKVGSRDNHTDLVGRDCVFTLQAKPDFTNNRLFRLTLIDVKASK